MKKIILVFALLLSFIAVAQNFPGEKIELLSGKNLKVLPLSEASQKYGYRDFYTDVGLENVYKEEKSTTPYNALVGKEFKVISYEPYQGYKEIKHKLLLENPETGKLYFDYSSKYSFNFPFEVIGGLIYPEGFFCDLIVKESASSSTSYTTPIEEGSYIVKNKGDKVLAYTFRYATTEKYSPEKLWKGVTIVFENGAKIAVPAQVIASTKSSSGNVNLSASLIVHEAKYLSLLQSQPIKSIIFEKSEMVFKGGKVLQEYAKCLLTKLP